MRFLYLYILLLTVYCEIASAYESSLEARLDALQREVDLFLRDSPRRPFVELHHCIDHIPHASRPIFFEFDGCSLIYLKEQKFGTKPHFP